jgi:acetylornithine deacetylase/succinyl-diaminopimelate desuccinylase-like protein
MHIHIKVSLLVLALSLSISTTVYTQQVNKAVINEWVQPHLQKSFSELKTFLSIPNDSHFENQILENIQWLEEAFKMRNFNTVVLKSKGNPSLFAEKAIDPNLKTVLFYMHFDGQPVDSSKWLQPNPYTPVLKQKNQAGGWDIVDWSRLQNEPDEELRFFCRSSSDDKSPINMLLSAIDVLKANNHKPTFNIKVILDSEEELGSPNLPEIVDNYKDLLASDMMLILDGPRHISNQPSIFFGCRGLASVEITVFGPKNAQHSGHYGNYAPNPALNLAKLLASMKDDEGRVIIPGFYDGIEMDKKTLEILAQVPDDLSEINQKLGIAIPDKVGADYQQSLQYPSLNIRGMSSGWVGDEVRTIVPGSATAALDIRLVVESDPIKLISLVKKHIEGQGFYVIDHLPNDQERAKYPKIAMFNGGFENLAFRTEFDSEIGEWVNRSLIKAFEEQPVRVRTTGGTVPISAFISKLGIEAVILPMVNLDNNQHGPNENLRLGNYTDGIKTLVALLTEKI